MSVAKKTTKKAKPEPTKLSRNSAQIVGALAVMLAFALPRSTAKQKKAMWKKFETALKKVKKATLEAKVVDELHIARMAAYLVETTTPVVTAPTIGFCSGARGNTKAECTARGGVWNGKPIDIFELFDNPYFIPDRP
jgi:hypothetical protein